MKLHRLFFLTLFFLPFCCYTQENPPAKMLVVIPDEWIMPLDFFVQHKQQQDIRVVMLPLSEAGNSADEIKVTIQNCFHDEGFDYLLLVGDDTCFPAPSVGGAPADNDYAMLVGDDLLPDVPVGKLSVESLEELLLQLNRIVTYERQGAAQSLLYCGIAGEGNYGGVADYEHIRRINASLVAAGLSGGYELFDGSCGGLDAPGNPSSSEVVELVNRGVNMINYAGHGTVQTWTTTQFGVAHLSLLTNTSQWPIVISLACGNGHYRGTTCLAEAWLRAAFQGKPAGAVAVVAAAADLPWRLPMVAHAAMIDTLATSPRQLRLGDAWLAGLRAALADTLCEALAHSWLLFGDPSMKWQLPACLAITSQSQGRLSVTPNPSSGRVRILCDGKASEIRLFDGQGRCIDIFDVLPDHKERVIDMGEWPAGIYLLQYGESVAKVLLRKN